MFGLGWIRGDGNAGERAAHHECRRCGTNLDVEAEVCPDCGGEVAVYRL